MCLRVSTGNCRKARPSWPAGTDGESYSADPRPRADGPLGARVEPEGQFALFSFLGSLIPLPCFHPGPSRREGTKRTNGKSRTKGVSCAPSDESVLVVDRQSNASFCHFRVTQETTAHRDPPERGCVPSRRLCGSFCPHDTLASIRED